MDKVNGHYIVATYEVPYYKAFKCIRCKRECYIFNNMIYDKPIRSFVEKLMITQRYSYEDYYTRHEDIYSKNKDILMYTCNELDIRDIIE